MDHLDVDSTWPSTFNRWASSSSLLWMTGSTDAATVAASPGKVRYGGEPGENRFNKPTPGIQMKTTGRSIIAAAVALGALVGTHGAAGAAITTQHASICHPYLNSPGTGLSYGPGGLVNGSIGTVSVICPIVRSEDAGVIGMHTFVNAFVPGGTFRCTLWSHSSYGSPLAATTFTFVGVGGINKVLALTPAQVPAWSSQSLVCSLPPGVQLFNIESAY